VSDFLTIRDNLVLADGIMSRLGLDKVVLDEFVAGTMFWFKFDAMKNIAETEWTENEFGPELGQIDGTLAHAFERVFGPYVKALGGQILRYEFDSDAKAAPKESSR
jgi:lipopolysaccharide biosynthesis protein